MASGSVNLRRPHHRGHRFVGEGRDDAGRPEAILGPRIAECRVRVVGLPVLRPVVGRLEAPDRRNIRIRHLEPGPHVEPERQHRDQRRPRLPHELVAGAAALRPDAAAAERRAEIEQVVADDLPVARGDDAVERVRAADLVVIQPGGEDRQAAQLAAVFVRDDVVGIVGARAVVAERSERPARDVAAGEHAVAAVGLPRRALENLVEVVATSAAALGRPRPSWWRPAPPAGLPGGRWRGSSRRRGSRRRGRTWWR